MINIGEKSKRARTIEAFLDRYIPSPAIPLHHDSPFQLLIAVLLSQSATDRQVNLVTPHLFSMGGTAKAMKELSVEQIEGAIHSVGLAPTKAKRIHEIARILEEQHDGEVPPTFELLESLPGVGHKTASCVLSQAFGVPAFPVDTHILRCAKRWGLTAGSTVVAVERDLKELFPSDLWGKIHLQMIYFAREYCPAKRHDPTKCPICSILS